MALPSVRGVAGLAPGGVPNIPSSSALPRDARYASSAMSITTTSIGPNAMPVALVIASAPRSVARRRCASVVIVYAACHAISPVAYATWSA